MAEKPLQIEIVAHAPTAYYHCTHCEVIWQESGFSKGLHQEQIASSLPPDMLQDYRAIGDWVKRLFQVYCDRVEVKVVDAASLEGVWKTLRYRLRKYPAVIVAGQAKFSGADFNPAEAEIARQLQALPA